MNLGKTLFAQVMEFLPWKTFGRIVARHKGDAGVHTLGCANLSCVMAFAQLRWRESLRDIESCLAADPSAGRTAWRRADGALAARQRHLPRTVAPDHGGGMWIDWSECFRAAPSVATIRCRKTRRCQRPARPAA